MLSEVKAIEALLKQVLYGCVEHVQATKAALYLSASHDLNAKTYELVTSYQYNVGDRRSITANDDLVDRLFVRRAPFVVNSLAADQRFAEMLFRQGNERMLVVPLFSRGRLVGFIDMRDKAGKKPFEDADLAAGTKIGEQMLQLLTAKKLFGLAPIPLSADPTAAPAAPQSAANIPQPPMQASAAAPGDALHTIDAARQFMAQRQYNVQAKRTISEADIATLQLFMPAALAIPGAVIAALSIGGRTDNPQAIVAIADVSDDAMTSLLAHIAALLARINQPHEVRAIHPQYPFGTQNVPVTSASVTALSSALVAPQSADGLVMTVAFERVAESHAQRALQAFLKQMEPAIETALAATAGRTDRLALAEHLLEPDLRKVPELAAHSRQVSALAHRFARALDLPPAQTETVRVAALVHDVAFRLLDYERLYRKQNLTPEDRRIIVEHPVVGAAIVEPLLGSEVAQAVLRHHERIDGTGYPSRLSANQIPLASRIIQIADAWVTMTSAQSYQAPISRDHAAEKLREAAGTQFDATLVERFLSALTVIAH